MLDEKGLSPLVASIVLLTVTLAVGAVVAATIAGSPRPTLPLSSALHITDSDYQNLSQGDNEWILEHEWGEKLDLAENDLQVRVNGVKEWSSPAMEFEIGDIQSGDFAESKALAVPAGELESGDLVTVYYKPRKLTLIEYLVQ